MSLIGSLLLAVSGGGRAGSLEPAGRRSGPSREGPALDARPSGPPVSLEMIAERAKLKAEAARWAVQRRVLEARGADFETEIRPQDEALVARAKALPDCFVWTLSPQTALPDAETMETIAGCYECLAAAAESMEALDRAGADRDLQQQGMLLIAAGQSALRQALFNADRRQRDTDQEEAFRWLKQQTAGRRIYVPRHMRLNDPADPAQWQSRVEEARRLVEQAGTDKDRADAVRGHFDTIRAHAERVDAGEATEEDWAAIDRAVATLVEEFGVAPGSTPMCEALELAVDGPPEGIEVGPALRIALRECEAWLDTFEDDEGEDWEDAEPEAAQAASA
ncbi:MAG: hypothetical protein D6693_00120 [Planctomycetota bacterium]|nr:MAG: hypothetical protein D6693_00120 [Planctomycetota bacterium]